jgi:hypothetical protein
VRKPAPKPADVAAAPRRAGAAGYVVSSPLMRGRARGKEAKPAAFQSPYIERFRDALAKIVAPAPRAVEPKKPAEAPPQTDEGAAPEAAGKPPVGQLPARAPTSPAEDPLFQSARAQVRTESKRQRKHVPASRKKEEAARASALLESEQVEQSSKEESTKEMERIGAAQQDDADRFSAKKFKDDLKARVDKKAPHDEREAKDLAKQPPLENFEQQFASDVAEEQRNVIGPLEEKAKQPPSGGRAEKPIVEVPKAAAPSVPQSVDPKLAAPKPKAWWEISLQRESDRLDEAMRENRLSDQQLADSREPSFIETLKVKQEAQKKVVEAPQVYRQREAAILQATQARGGQSLSAGLEGMSAIKGRAAGQVYGGQKKTETKTEKRQREIKGTIDGLYEGTVTDVKRLLKDMTDEVKVAFAKALTDATGNFNEEVRRRISDYYGDWRIDDDLFGPDDVIVDEHGNMRAMTFEEKFSDAKRINPDVYRIFVQEKGKFLGAMDTALEDIANNVETGLKAAHNRIRKGEADIADFKSTLKGEELVYAGGLEQEVKMKFETLEASIDDTREDLLQTMADQYSESVGQLEKTFNEINDELKKGWLERAAEFIKTVGKTIFQLADLLLTILSRMAGLIWDIVKHPIRFFETLVAGLMQGIGQFIGSIGTYMQEAFWSWITKATPAKNIRLSAGSGIESLFDLVVQVLNLGPADLRVSVEKVLGKEFMQMIDKAMALGEKAMAFGEKALEPVAILFSKGPGALWDYIKDQMSDIVRSSFDRIRESVFNTFIEKALKWIAGFFIPGGGFVKVVKAIFRAFQFVAENLERIRHFFDSVFDSMEAATQGRSEGVASKIIMGLKMGIVLALDFLAKQLGFDKIVDGVQKIIQSIRRPIVSAIEWLLGKVKPFALRIVQAAAGAAKKVWGGVKATVGKVFAWWKKRMKVGEGKNAHTIFFRGELESAEIYIESTPRVLGNYISSLRIDPDYKGADKEKILDRIDGKIGEIKTWEAELKTANDRGHVNVAATKSQAISDGFDYIGGQLGQLFLGEAYGTEADPIPLAWAGPRSDAYPLIYFGGRLPPANRPKRQAAMKSIHKKNQNDETGTPVTEYSPIKRAVLPGGGTIGLTDPYFIRIGRVVGPLTQETTPGGGALGRLIEPYGFSAEDDGMQLDHVHEIQFGGVAKNDKVENLWPLAQGLNSRKGRALASANVEYPKGHTVKIPTLKTIKNDDVTQKKKFFFKIKSVE